MPALSFLQELMDPIPDPLMLISVHDGTILAMNMAMVDVSGAFTPRTQTLIGESYYDIAVQVGIDPDEMPIHRARVRGGRHTANVTEPVPMQIIAAQEDGYILCSIWKPGHEEVAIWTHEWYWMGLKNALQMDAVTTKAALATSLVSEIHSLAEQMKRTYTQRAEHIRDRPWRVTTPLEMPPAKLRPVEQGL